MLTTAVPRIDTTKRINTATSRAVPDSLLDIWSVDGTGRPRRGLAARPCEDGNKRVSVYEPLFESPCTYKDGCPTGHQFVVSERSLATRPTPARPRVSIDNENSPKTPTDSGRNSRHPLRGELAVSGADNGRRCAHVNPVHQPVIRRVDRRSCLLRHRLMVSTLGLATVP